MVMTIYVANSFSLNMLDFSDSKIKTVVVEEIDTETVKELLKNSDFISAIGHEATAKVISQKLGINVEANRVQIKMNRGDVLIVFQLLQRLPEGKVLSEEEIQQIPCKWFEVIVI